jgi:hypothetical protein
MKYINSHRKDKFRQPVLGMSFEGLKEGQHIESYASVAKRTAESFHVKEKNNITGEWKRISEEFETEDKAIDFCSTLENDLHTRIYSDKDMHISGW